MSRWARIKEILFSIFMILCAIILLTAPDKQLASLTVALILSLVLCFIGARMIFYYATMARHMVGGLATLFTGIIVLDLSITVTALLNNSSILIVFYLIGFLGLSGVLAILQSIDAKNSQSPWKLSFSYGLVNVVATIVCVFHWQSYDIVILVFSLGLIHSGFNRILQSMRPQDIVYIQ